MRNRISAVIGIGILSLAGLTWVLSSAGRPTDQPTPTPAPMPAGIFSEVGGWIVYGNEQGIWAVDPSHPSDPGGQIQLSPNPGTPLSWSSDGSKLLISRRGSDAPLRGLFVLHADGTETHLLRNLVSGAAFSPDGTKVVFASKSYSPADPGIYLIEADGGVPRLLLEPGRRYYPPEDRSFRTVLSLPTFSPDGTQIAYIDGMGDWGNSLRVMNADGSDVHVLDGSDVHLLEFGEAPNGTGSVRSLGMHPNGLSWSPDGMHLAVGLLNDGISVVDADGSGLTLAIPDGRNPHWSPDGTRISFRLGHLGQNQLRWVFSPLEIAAADGTQVVEFGYAGSGPWNPLVQPEPEVAEVPAASEGLTQTSTLLLVVVLLALVAGAVLVRRWMERRS